MILALDALISPSGKILIPGIREAVAPLSDEEWKMYQDIEFDIDNYKNKIGVNQLMYSNKVRVNLDNDLCIRLEVIAISLLTLGGLVSPHMAIPHCLHPRH